MSSTSIETSHVISSQSTSKSVHLDSLFFPVEIYDLPNEILFSKLNFALSYAQVVYLPFQEKVVNFSGRNYMLTTNEEFFTPIYEELTRTFGTSQIIVNAINEDDCRFCVDFIIDSKELLVAHNDIIKLMVRGRNSYDGTQKSSIEFLAYRQVCSNGLCAWQTFNAPGINKGILKHHTDTSKLIKGLGSSLASFNLNKDKFEPFTDRMVTVQERDLIIEALKEFKGSVSFPKRLLPEVPNKIAEEMAIIGSNQLSAWQLYNGFNYFLSHDSRINLRNSIKGQIDIHVKEVIAGALNIPFLN
jgi:Domain of unknown function (DUF932)